jgi:cytoskeletal protein RodZ
MSYILDALRKSEHERQAAAGQSTGLLYPIEIEQNHKPWYIIILLTLTAIIACSAIWWMWMRTTVTEVVHEIDKPVVAIVSQPAASFKQIIPELNPEPISKPQKPTSIAEQKKIRNSTPADSPKTTLPEAIPKSAAATNQTVSTDPLKDLPTLNITGYLHNEENGNLAMINNQLVREGEEIVPGLRLVKVLDNNAIFSYKGYVFSR